MCRLSATVFKPQIVRAERKFPDRSERAEGGITLRAEGIYEFEVVM